jgi:hypothetical protein
MIVDRRSKIDPDCMLAILNVARDPLKGPILYHVMIGLGAEDLQPSMRAAILARKLS